MDFAVPILGSLAGAAAAGSYLTGAPVVDVLTAMNGAAGITAGMVAGGYAAMTYAASNMTTPKPNVGMDFGLMVGLPLAGGIAVPMLAGGRLDSTLLLMLGGAVAGQKLASMLVAQSK